MPFEDFYITDGGDLGFGADGGFLGVEGGKWVGQGCNVRLDTRKSEWSFDTLIGVDYFGLVFVKNADITAIRSDLVTQLQDVPGLARVTKIEFNIQSNYLLNVIWSGVTDDGMVIGGITTGEST